MRTTLSIDDHVLRQAKQTAAAEGRTLSDLVTESLRERMARRQTATKVPLQLVTYKGNGVLPGVDLNNNAAVRDLMDFE